MQKFLIIKVTSNLILIQIHSKTFKINLFNFKSIYIIKVCNLKWLLL